MKVPQHQQSYMRNCLVPILALFAAIFTTASTGFAQADLPIYTDNLVNGFQDWSWASHNLTNASPTYTGSGSISVSDVAWTAISFEHADFNVIPYTNLNFWANGGASGGQRLQVFLEYGPNGASNGPAYSLPTALPANNWQQYTIPLNVLNVAGVSNYNRVTIQLTSNGTTNLFYVDAIQLGAALAPALTHLNVDATQTIRPADARWFGVNTATWDNNLGNSRNAPAGSASGLPGAALAWRFNVRHLSLGRRREPGRQCKFLLPCHQSRHPSLYHRQLRVRQQQRSRGLGEIRK